MKNTIATLAGAMLGLSGCADGDPVADDGVAEGARAPADASVSQTPDYRGSDAPPGPKGDDGALGSDAVSQGEWFAKEVGGHPAALFGPPRSEARFSVRCENGRLVFVHGIRVEGDTAAMRLMAGGKSHTISADAHSDPLPQVSGSLSPDAPFARTLSAATEPIAVAIGEGPSFSMPASPILRDVVSNCTG